MAKSDNKRIKSQLHMTKLLKLNNRRYIGVGGLQTGSCPWRALQCNNLPLVVMDYFALNFKEYTDKILKVFQLNPLVNAFIYLVTSCVLSRIMYSQPGIIAT